MEEKTRTEPTVSIVMPLYNGDSLLEETLGYLKAQTRSDFEALIVDDGSTDGGPDTVRRIAREDPRFLLITQQNRFAGAARNNGLSRARGEYVLFLDSDDLFEPELIETAVARAEETGADVVTFNADFFNCRTGEISERKRYLQSRYMPEGVFSAKDAKDAVFNCLVPWTQLWRRAYLEKIGIRYQEIFANNDLYFNAMGMALADRIATVDRVLLHYRVGQLDNIQSKTDRDPLSAVKAIDGIREGLKEHGLLDAFHDSLYFRSVMSLTGSLTAKRTWTGFSTLYNYLHEHMRETLGEEPAPKGLFAEPDSDYPVMRKISERVMTLTLEEFILLWCPICGPGKMQRVRMAPVALIRLIGRLFRGELFRVL